MISPNRVSKILLVTIMVLLMATSAASAYGIQRHTVGGIDHGCLDSYGCYNSNTNYIREAFNKCASCGADADMDYSRVQIFYETGALRNTASCYNCNATYGSYNTYPVHECKYFSGHSSSGPTLNAHAHYTSSAPC